tara:strand:+ start:253 stop:708 length:456 start_codon:yes stop_codon:yes gene_type:complete
MINLFKKKIRVRCKPLDKYISSLYDNDINIDEIAEHHGTCHLVFRWVKRYLTRDALDTADLLNDKNHLDSFDAIIEDVAKERWISSLDVYKALEQHGIKAWNSFVWDSGQGGRYKLDSSLEQGDPCNSPMNEDEYDTIVKFCKEYIGEQDD